MAQVRARNVRTQANERALAGGQGNTCVGDTLARSFTDGRNVRRQKRGQECSLDIAPFDLSTALGDKARVRYSRSANHNQITGEGTCSSQNPIHFAGTSGPNYSVRFHRRHNLNTSATELPRNFLCGSRLANHDSALTGGYAVQMVQS